MLYQLSYSCTGWDDKVSAVEKMSWKDGRYLAEIAASCNLFFQRWANYSAGVCGSKVVLRWWARALADLRA
jgi:hypothetical protein